MSDGHGLEAVRIYGESELFYLRSSRRICLGLAVRRVVGSQRGDRPMTTDRALAGVVNMSFDSQEHWLIRLAKNLSGPPGIDWDRVNQARDERRDFAILIAIAIAAWAAAGVLAVMVMGESSTHWLLLTMANLAGLIGGRFSALRR